MLEYNKRREESTGDSDHGGNSTNSGALLAGALSRAASHTSTADELRANNIANMVISPREPGEIIHGKSVSVAVEQRTRNMSIGSAGSSSNTTTNGPGNIVRGRSDKRPGGGTGMNFFPRMTMITTPSSGTNGNASNFRLPSISNEHLGSSLSSKHGSNVGVIASGSNPSTAGGNGTSSGGVRRSLLQKQPSFAASAVTTNQMLANRCQQLNPV